MKLNKLKYLMLAGTLACGMGLSAQTVNQRQEDQQGRIANGVQSGELTPHETRNLEGKEGAIHREVRRDRAANGGYLRPGQKARVQRQQNGVSRQIYNKKHNDRVD